MARHYFKRSRLLNAEQLSLLVFVTLHLVVHFMFRVLLVLPVLLVRHFIGSHFVVFHHAVTHLVIGLHCLRILLCGEQDDG